VSAASIGDIAAALARSLPSLSAEERAEVAAHLETVRVEAGGRVLEEGSAGRDLYFVVSGEACVTRGGTRVQRLGAGGRFGELGLITGRPRQASVKAQGPLGLARLSRPRYEALARVSPDLARRLLEDLISCLGLELADMTDGVSLLLGDRSLPRRAEVRIRCGDAERSVPVGTPAAALLAGMPCDGSLVAALLDGKPVSLGTAVLADATLAPLGDGTIEGRRIRRLTIGLLLLEAAARAAPSLQVSLGSTVAGGQVVHVEGALIEAPAALAARITAAMRAISTEDAPVRVETWMVDEARAELAARGQVEAAALLRSARDASVALVTAGRFLALAPGPLLPTLGGLGLASLEHGPGGFTLVFRDGAPDGASVGGDAPPPKDHREMARAHEAWLALLGSTSVGAFNDRCISGQVSEIIRVAEGFHEKRIGMIADRIAARGAALRVICVAGPSSAGKTTFIKRLIVQLRVNGLNPKALSLDDYYVDRERTPLDARGEYDYEALHALDLAALREDLRRIMGGETVRTPRYDFLTGRSLRHAGPEVHLRPSDVLLIEGIHGLNPALMEGAASGDAVFRVFLDPTTTLRFDRLARTSAADVRLLRRIVRDRFKRGAGAADNIARWASVRDGEARHIFPFAGEADATFDSALVYEPAVLKVYADRYLLEVPREHPSFATAHRLRHLIDRFVTIYPDHVPPTSLLREFIGGSGFEY